MTDTEVMTAVARRYARNVRELQSGAISADEHRRVNRELRAMMPDDAQWERVKATVFGRMSAHS